MPGFRLSSRVAQLPQGIAAGSVPAPQSYVHGARITACSHGIRVRGARRDAGCAGDCAAARERSGALAAVFPRSLRVARALPASLGVRRRRMSNSCSHASCFMINFVKLSNHIKTTVFDLFAGRVATFRDFITMTKVVVGRGSRPACRGRLPGDRGSFAASAGLRAGAGCWRKKIISQTLKYNDIDAVRVIRWQSGATVSTPALGMGSLRDSGNSISFVTQAKIVLLIDSADYRSPSSQRDEHAELPRQ